jgi:NitT/TauT family transport system substrate-binding protein
MKVHTISHSRHLRLAAAAFAAVSVPILMLAGCAESPGPAPMPAQSLPTGLEPQPLAETTHVVISVPFRTIENFTPLFLAEVLGEYEKENLDVEWRYAANADDLAALGQGQIQMMAMGASAFFFNAVDSGVNVRVVFPGMLNNPGRDGLWVGNEIAEQGPEALRGATIASAVGPSSSSVLGMAAHLEQGGLSIKDVTVQAFPAADVSTALIQGAVEGAWIQSNLGTQVEQAGAGQFVSGMPEGAGSVLANYAFGPDLLLERPEVGQAILRAIARTVTEHLSGDYKANRDTVEAIAAALDLTPEDVVATPSLEFDDSFRVIPEFFTEVQDVWHEIGDVLNYDGVLEPDEIIDTKYIDALNAE